MISPLASIHPNAKLGNNVTVEPFAIIHDNVVIGDDSHIMSHAVLMPFSRIGKNCKIFPGAVIAAIPQDLKFIGEETTADGGETAMADQPASEENNGADDVPHVIAAE